MQHILRNGHINISVLVIEIIYTEAVRPPFSTFPWHTLMGTASITVLISESTDKVIMQGYKTVNNATV